VYVQGKMSQKGSEWAERACGRGEAQQSAFKQD
jgi:hypothetical protein